MSKFSVVGTSYGKMQGTRGWTSQSLPVTTPFIKQTVRGLRHRRAGQRICQASLNSEARQKLQQLAKQLTAVTLSGLCLVGGVFQQALLRELS